jgi:hypothetical protein
MLADVCFGRRSLSDNARSLTELIIKVRPVFEVADFEKAMKDSERRWSMPDKGSLEIPNDPCAIFKDPSGNEFAIFQDVRPNVCGQGWPSPWAFLRQASVYRLVALVFRRMCSALNS